MCDYLTRICKYALRCMLVALLGGSFGFAGCVKSNGEVSEAAYFWHRVRGERLAEVLEAFTDWEIYALVAEYRAHERPVKLKPIDGATPVVRLDARVWQEDGFVERFVSDLEGLPEGEIQLDCDVPESKLGKYAVFLGGLRERLPRHTFSVTLLPCHLKHEALREVCAQVQYVVLQLHALERPKDLPETYQLFDVKVAEAAVARMRTLSVPFKLALPSYAYMVHYDAEGKFRRLSAETLPALKAGESRRLAAPNWEELIAFRRANADLAVIWFRLPQVGDRLALEAENLKRLSRNELPRMEAEIIFEEQGHITQIYWKNHGLLGTVPFTQTLGGGGEFFAFNGVRPVGGEVPPGQVPERVTGTLPSPGNKLLIGEILRWQRKQ